MSEQPEHDAYRERIAAMDDRELASETARCVIGAGVANNFRTGHAWDVHWKTDLCYAECERRTPGQLYDRAFRMAERDCA